MDHDSRPVNLELTAFSFPIAALASIAHRIAGAVLFVGMAFLLYALDQSLASRESFDAMQSFLAAPLVKLVIWGLLAALLYHLVAGVKHLLLDFGIGESVEGGALAAKIVIVSAGVLILAGGVWIFG